MKKILYIFLIAFLSISCSDFLEEDNKGGIASDDLYGTERGFEELVVASYNSLRTVYGREPWLWVSGTDMYMISRRGNAPEIQSYLGLDPTNTQVWEFYRDVYRGIQTINTGIYYAERGPSGMNAATLAMRKAELRFLRAYYHFILAEQFGGIAINSRITDAPREDLPRTSLTETYQFIITEMEAIVNDLPAIATQAGRIDQQVVKHFLAKAYLTRGYDLGNNADFTTARNLANEVIGGRELTLPFDELWHPSNQDNEEVIWSIQYSIPSLENPESGGNMQQALFAPYLGGQAEGNKNTATQFPVTWHVHNRFEADDARYSATFMQGLYPRYFDYWQGSDDHLAATPYRNYYPRIPGQAFTKDDADAWRMENPTLRGDTTANIPNGFATGWIRFDAEGNRVRNAQGVVQYDLVTTINPVPANANTWSDLVQNHAPVKKFDDPSNLRFNVRSSTRNVVVARLAETYFIAAEAALALGQPGDAAAYINTVRNRAGNSISGAGLTDITSGEMTLDRLLIESSKEFVGEYRRWPELRRTGKLLEFALTYNPDILSADYFIGLDGHNKTYRPIPLNALDLNPRLTQNPGYGIDSEE